MYLNISRSEHITRRPKTVTLLTVYTWAKCQDQRDREGRACFQPLGKPVFRLELVS